MTSEDKYICPKCQNVCIIEPFYFDWDGGECDKCHLEWNWDYYTDEDYDEYGHHPSSWVDGKVTPWTSVSFINFINKAEREK